MDAILLHREQIQSTVRHLAEAISKDFEGKELLAVGILKGSFIFMADLVRHITVPVTIDFIDISSYGLAAESSGEVRILKDLDTSVEGRNVLVVEDIVDTGLTLKYLLGILRERNPRSLRVCTLLDKPSRRRTVVTLDYCGFEIPDVFVVGYGLDYAEKYRNYPDIWVIKPSS